MTLGKRKLKMPRSFSPSDHCGDTKKKVKAESKTKRQKKASTSEPKIRNTMNIVKSKKKSVPYAKTDTSSSDDGMNIVTEKEKLKEKIVGTSEVKIRKTPNAVELQKNDSYAKNDDGIDIAATKENLEEKKAGTSEPTIKKPVKVIKSEKNHSKMTSSLRDDDVRITVEKGILEKQNVLSPKNLVKNRKSSTGSPTKKELKAIIQNYQRLASPSTKIASDERIAHGSSSPRINAKQRSEIIDDGLQKIGAPSQECSDHLGEGRISDTASNEELPDSLNSQNPFENQDSGSTVDDSDDKQLFGRDYRGEEMVLLQDGIYCKKKILKMTLGTSHQATHVARRLLEGVFKRDTLLNCTLTGQVARSQGKDRQNQDVLCMHDAAKEAIINYALSVAQRNRWTEQSVKEIKRAMAQKLVEMKQTARKNKA